MPLSSEDFGWLGETDLVSAHRKEQGFSGQRYRFGALLELGPLL